MSRQKRSRKSERRKYNAKLRSTYQAMLELLEDRQVLSANPVLTAVADAVQVQQDHAAQLDVTVNDQLAGYDVDVALTQAPTHGTAQMVEGAIVYSPSAGFTGQDSLEYRLVAADGSYSEALVTLTVVDPYAPESDWDGDGIARSEDLDDDNDGLLDVMEGGDAVLDIGSFDGLSISGTQSVSSSIAQPGGSGNVTLTLSGESGAIWARESSRWFSSRDPSSDGSGLTFDSMLTRDQKQKATFEFDTVVSNLSFVVTDIDSGNLAGPEAMTIEAEHDGVIYTLSPDDVEVLAGPGPSQSGNDFAGDGASLTNVIRIHVPGPVDKLTLTLSGTQTEQVRAVVTVYNLNYSIDTDGDGVIDAMDLDSDNDGISDLVESGAEGSVLAVDANGDGSISIAEAEALMGAGQADVDEDGLLDVSDADTGSASASASTGTVPADSDDDGVADFLDLDSDNDGIPDAVEARPTFGYQAIADDGSDTVDTDGDGVLDRFDSSSAFGSTDVHFSAPLDTDGDGMADYRDTDSDADGSLDAEESGLTANGAVYGNADGTINSPSTQLANLDGTDTSEVAYRESVVPESILRGSVVLTADTAENAFAGMVGNNEIQLTGTDYTGNLVSETVLTEPDGTFQFNGLLPGTYAIGQVQPPFVIDGEEIAGTSGQVTDNDVIGNITIDGSGDGLLDGFAFHEMAPARLSGFVYHDESTDHVAGEAEQGIANAQVLLTGTDDRGEVVNVKTTTDSRGFYEFTGLRPGTYALQPAAVANFIDGAPSIGSNAGYVAGTSITDVVLAAGDEAVQYNFGKATPSSIAGATYLDQDKDGVFDNSDTALGGVTVTLTGTDIHGNQVERTQQSSADGTFLFDNLVPGTYALAGEQPEGLLDGRENLGRRVKHGHSDADGVRGNDVISGIEIGYGYQMEGYGFGETIDYAFASQFDNQLVIPGTGGDDVFEFTAGSSQHTIRVNGEPQYVDASLISSIRFDGLEGNDAITIHGSEMTEKVELWPARGLMHSRDWQVEATSTETITVYHGGGYDVGYLHDSADNDGLKSTESYARMWGTGQIVFENEVNGFHRTYAYSREGGEDRAYLYDSARDDTMKAEDDRVRMFGRNYYNAAIDFERVYGYANSGGEDTLRIWDSSASDDTFEFRPDSTRVYNTNFYNYGEGFERVIANANRGGSNDVAHLYGTAGDNAFIASARGGSMTGDGIDVTANSFERLYSHGEGGNDTAVLNDTIVRDNFVARPRDARMYNDRYFIAALGFADVDAYSSRGGNDRAYFHDSTGDDAIYGLANEVRMTGDSFDNASHGFRRAYVTADAGGHDTATLYEANLADTFDGRVDRSRMYGDGYYTEVKLAEKVDAVFGGVGAYGGYDRAIVDDEIDDEVANTIRSIFADNTDA